MPTEAVGICELMLTEHPFGREAAWPAGRWAHSVLFSVTSRCSSHVEFGAGFGERWCAYLRGCALLSGSWAGERVEEGGGRQADPLEYHVRPPGQRGRAVTHARLAGQQLSTRSGRAADADLNG
jgi:hypothetical protein